MTQTVIPTPDGVSDDLVKQECTLSVQDDPPHFTMTFDSIELRNAYLDAMRHVGLINNMEKISEH